jgi:hypothetical protein
MADGPTPHTRGSLLTVEPQLVQLRPCCQQWCCWKASIRKRASRRVSPVMSHKQLTRQRHSYSIHTESLLRTSYHVEVDRPEAILRKSTHVGVDVQLELPVDNNEVYFVALCQLSAYNISSFGRCYRRRPQSLSTMKVCTKFCSKITDMDDYLCRFNSSGILQGTTNFCKRAEQGKIRNQSPRRLAVIRC